MARITHLAGFAVLLTLCMVAAPAQAQLARTFVSSLGNDANDCQRLTPCRTFQGAHDKTLANGEITVLDPGGYGAVTITKAISIINDGVGEAGVLVSGGLNGITINAGTSDAVSLRGLTVKGIGFGGGNGIVFNSGKSLTMENCAIRTLDGGATGFGIRFIPTVASSLAVSNTVVTDNSQSGIYIAPLVTSSTVTATISRLEVYNNQAYGLFVNGATSTGTLNVTAADSTAAGNAVGGFFVSADVPQAATSLMLVRSVAAGNFTGISANGTNAVLRVGQSTVTGSAISWSATAGATLSSYADNNIDGNGDGSPAPPTIAKK